MRQTELHLTEEDRLVVDDICGKGLHRSREVKRVHVLSALDRSVPEARIMAVPGMGRTAVWRTRAAYLQGGVELAVFDVARSGRPCHCDTDDEARLTALACSAPPAGRQRWAMVELERAARQETGAVQGAGGSQFNVMSVWADAASFLSNLYTGGLNPFTILMPCCLRSHHKEGEIRWTSFSLHSL